MSKFLLPVYAASVSMLAVGTALAQPVADGTSNQQLDDIVVTARKRSESLQNVPVAVAAITSTALENNNAADLTKVAELAPQVLIGTSSSGAGAMITIRGISSSPSNAGFDQSVSISFDGVQLSRGRILSASVFDMQQVEVLQGPQALFFGKNSPAGVISMTSRDPGHDFEAYVKAGYEFVADERYVEGALSVPISSTLGARFAMRASKIDGWVRNIAERVPDPVVPGVFEPGNTMGSRLPAGHNYAGRLTLLWEPEDDFTAKLKLTFDEKVQNGSTANSEPFCIGSTTVPTSAGGIVMPNADCRKDRVLAISSLAPEFAVNYPYANGGVPRQVARFFLGSLNMDKSFGDVTLSSTTGFYRQTTTGSGIGDWSPFARIYTVERAKYRLFTQELRINTDFDGPLNAMAGVYFDSFKRPWFNAPDLFHPMINPDAGNYTLFELDALTKGESYSAFGQVRWTPVPSIEIAAGARYSKDVKRAWYENTANNPAAAFFGIALYPQNQVIHSRYSEDDISPEVTVSWKPSDDQLIYGAYKTGYKAGGISNAAILQATDTPQSLPFDRESVDGFEIGYKGELFDRRVRLNVTAYTYKYKGLQVIAFDTATFSYQTMNAASARTKGVTGQLTWLATDSLTFDGSLGYNKGRYISFPNAQCYTGQTAAEGCTGGVQDLSGRPLVRAPKLTFNIGADYKTYFGNGWMANLATSAAYTSSYETSSDLHPAGHQDSFWRLNASLRVGPEDGRYELALIGRNLTNSYYMLNSNGWSGSGSSDQYVGYFNRPREVAVQGTVRF